MAFNISTSLDEGKKSGSSTIVVSAGDGDAAGGDATWRFVLIR